jgi:hypothetical protein
LSTTDAVLGLLLALWLFIPPQHEGQPMFAPRAGATVTKNFDLAVEVRDITVEIDGQEFLALGQSPIRLLTSSRFTDTYVKTEAGRPLELLRTFDEISGKWEVDGLRTDIVGFYSLSGCAVRFVWDQKLCDYSRTLEVGKVRDLHEAQLVEDLDLRGFLPEGRTKIGTKWTAHGRPVVDALFGSTEMGLLGMPREQELEVLIRDVLLQPFRELGNRRLAIECVRVELDEPGIAAMALVELRLVDKYELDVTETLNQFFRSLYPSWSTALRVDSACISLDIDGQGRLQWNLAENRFEELDLAARLHLQCDLEMSRFMAAGSSPTMRVRLHSDGDAKWTVRVAKVP